MKKQNKQLFITGGLVLLLIVVFRFIVLPEGASKDETRNSSKAQAEGDIKIIKEEVTGKASFYPYEIDGVNLEVMAVKAEDGTVRTAFNTCQVCYASGRGYYKQEGDYIVCQNCGNAYTSEEVEVITGGCNPVPITKENKTESDDTITINRGLLEEYQSIFANWKTNS